MLGILAEDRSDAETLDVLSRRILNTPNLSVKKKGFGSCHELCRKGAKTINLFKKQGVSRFIICHDADGHDPRPAQSKVKRIIDNSGVNPETCILVPVEEIESWMIADEIAVKEILPKFIFKPVGRPEDITDPKEWIEDASALGRSRPLYMHATHNPRVAEYLDLEKVAAKCPSFRPLLKFLKS